MPHIGTRRGKAILDSLEEFKYLETWMIEFLFFKFKTGRNKCCQVMNNLYKSKMVYRDRLDSRDCYIYYLEKNRSAKWLHWLELNRFHFNLLKQLKSWHKLYYFKHEFKYSDKIADGFYVIENTTTSKAVKFFLEIVDNHNPFDKEENYIGEFKSNWKDKWWSDPRGNGKISFPKVVCVSTKPLKFNADDIRFVQCRPEDVEGDILKIIGI